MNAPICHDFPSCPLVYRAVKWVPVKVGPCLSLLLSRRGREAWVGGSCVSNGYEQYLGPTMPKSRDFVASIEVLSYAFVIRPGGCGSTGKLARASATERFPFLILFLDPITADKLEQLSPCPSSIQSLYITDDKGRLEEVHMHRMYMYMNTQVQVFFLSFSSLSFRGPSFFSSDTASL